MLFIIVLQEAAAVRQRHAALRAHPFFQLDIILKEGKDLVVRDSCGTSHFKIIKRSCLLHMKLPKFCISNFRVQFIIISFVRI